MLAAGWFAPPARRKKTCPGESATRRVSRASAIMRPRPRPSLSASPRGARTKRLGVCQLSARAFGPRHLLPRPATLWQIGCFPPRARAHHAPAPAPALVRVPARHPNKSPHAHQPSARVWGHRGPGPRHLLQDPPPCGKPAAFRRVPARTSCARVRVPASPPDARTRRLSVFQLAARVWATAGPSHATSLQDPPPCGKPAVFRRAA